MSGMPQIRKKPTWPGGMPRRNDINFDRELAKHDDPGHFKQHLPLVHVTPAWPAKEIIRDGKITTRRCDVFEVQLTYFFLLRPAYRSKDGHLASTQLARFPVAFILKPGAVPVPHHLYPFDTGAAAKGAFQSNAVPHVPLEDYALAASHDGALSHIEWAFGSLEAYYDGQLRNDIHNRYRPHEYVVSGFVDVARMGVEGSNAHDKRASTIELACPHNVDLNGNVLLSIFPKQCLEDNDDFVEKVRAFGGDVRTYDWQSGRAPDEFQQDIMRIARDFYVAQGILK
jgi:hypothetical protein